MSATTIAPVDPAERAGRSPDSGARTGRPSFEGLERCVLAPATLVIFGVGGDLARRKLLPALFGLAQAGLFPEQFHVVGVSRREQSQEEFRARVREAVVEFSHRGVEDEDELARFLELTSHVTLAFDDDAGYARLATWLDSVEGTHGASGTGHASLPDRCFYLSTAPEFFPVIASGLGGAGLTRREDADLRIILEKPFGHDLASARALDRAIRDQFEEQQILRVDHYLAKETVQNILAFRFANAMFEPLWNRDHIDHVQITVAESIGVGTRGGYYDRAGALRDLIQNHMLQLVALLCMEPPASLGADAVRDEKVKVLSAIAPPAAATIGSATVRAQYSGGVVLERNVPGYRDEPGIPGHSETETYAALRLQVDNSRWAGVPIFLRAGKRLARKVTEIAVVLKARPHLAPESLGFVGAQPNELVLAIEPNEGVSLRLSAKRPGPGSRIRPVSMEHRYGPQHPYESPDAYERLIFDALAGNHTLFNRSDEVSAQWAIVDPILDAWAQGDVPLDGYAAGSQGPAAADGLLGASRRWRPID